MIRLSHEQSVQIWHKAMKERATECSLCGGMAYSQAQDALFSGSACVIPSCGKECHAVCGRCLPRIPEHQRRCSCMPFGASACYGSFPTYRPRRLVRTWGIPCESCGTDVRCTAAVLTSGGKVTCGCGHSFCAKCGDESCTCSTIAEDQNPGCFSRYFVRSDGKPVRKRDITARMAEDEIRRRNLDSNPEEGFSVPCRRCDVHLARTSACHELSHCGSKICWASGRSSLPWERCLPSWHWNRVPRWEHEAPVSAFCCREGDCYTDDSECTLASHQEGRLEMARWRRELMLELMREEWNQSRN